MFHRPPGGYELDAGPGRFRIGLLALDNDRVFEGDMITMKPPGSDVMLYTSRVPFAEECTPETLLAMAHELTAATDTILPGTDLHAVIYGCTSGTAAIGFERVEQQIQAARPTAACVTPITAAHAAFDALGITRLAVLAPYSDEVTKKTVRALEDGGVQAVRVTNLGITRSSDINSVTPSSIRAAARFADDEQADGLFISCTDFRAVEVLQEIEDEIGKPVVSSNQAAFWQALRTSGYTKEIEGFGRLLRIGTTK